MKNREHINAPIKKQGNNKPEIVRNLVCDFILYKMYAIVKYIIDAMMMNLIVMHAFHMLRKK